jgi:hypothetical protein
MIWCCLDGAELKYLKRLRFFFQKNYNFPRRHNLKVAPILAFLCK